MSAPDPSGHVGGASPVVRIVNGNPTDVELAAAQAMIAAALAEQAEEGIPRLEPRVDGWHRSARQLRGHLTPGPGAWTGSRGTMGS